MSHISASDVRTKVVTVGMGKGINFILFFSNSMIVKINNANLQNAYRVWMTKKVWMNHSLDLMKLAQEIARSDESFRFFTHFV